MHIKLEENKLVIMHETEFEADWLDMFFKDRNGAYKRRTCINTVDVHAGYEIYTTRDE